MWLYVIDVSKFSWLQTSLNIILRISLTTVSFLHSFTPHPLRHLRWSFQTNTHTLTHSFLQIVGSSSGEGSHAEVFFPNCAYRGQTKIEAVITYLSTAVRLITGFVIDDSGFFFFIEFVCTFNFLPNTHYSRQNEHKRGICNFPFSLCASKLNG